MGVTIHYRGRLNDVGQLAKLCDELADIAATMGWESTRLDDDWEQPVDARLRHTPQGATIDGNLGLKGILMSPDGGAESLSFLFDRQGDLRCPMGMISDSGRDTGPAGGVGIRQDAVCLCGGPCMDHWAAEVPEETVHIGFAGLR